MNGSRLAAVTLVLALSGCPGRTEAPPREAARPPPELPKGPGVPVQGPPEALRSSLANAYALGPDRRFLRAFDELGRLVSGRACAQPAAATRAGDGWALAVCGEQVGKLPADPDLPDALALLQAFATRQLPGAPPSARPPTLPLLTADDALVRVAQVERASPPYSRADVHVLSAALAALSFALPDYTEVADDLRARSLAVFTLDRVLGGVDTAREEALIGVALGYQVAARAAAARLPAGDPLRAYLERDDATLGRLAHPHASAAVQLLWLRRLEDVDEDRAAVYRSPRARAPLGMGLERVRIDAFDVARTSGRDLARLVLTPSPQGFGRWRWSGDASLAQLDRVLARSGPSGQAFLRACFFDGVVIEADFALEKRSVADEAADLLRELGEASPGTAEDGLRRWLALRVAAERGSRQAADPLDAITAISGLGGYPRVELLSQAGDQLDHGDPALTAGLRRLVDWLDGRPRHRLWLSQLAAGRTQDPRLREEALRRAAHLGGDVWSRGWVAKLDGDVATLRALATDASLGASWQAFAVGLLAQEGVDEAEVERLYRAVLSRTRDDWAQRKKLVERLEERKRYADAELLVREWLGLHHPDRDLRQPDARTTLARLLSRQGRDAEAVEVIGPALPSWTLGVLKRGGIIQARLGHGVLARALGESAAGRYPGVAGAAAHAAVLWQLHDDEGAARVIAHVPPGRALDWYHEIAPAFVGVLEDDPAALDAFEALRRAGLDPIMLAHIPGEMYGRQHGAVAFAMASRLHHDDPIGDLELAVTAYRYLDGTQGRQASRAWLDHRVPPQLRAPLSMFAFAQQREELFWDLVPAPAGDTENDDFVWLMFAAASLRAPPTPEHASALAAHFAPDRRGFYHHLGRFLLGFEGVERVVRAATPGKRACETSFYVGLKAERNGDLATAADWYRAAVENGTLKDGEYRWASEQLGRWTSSGRSLARLAAEAHGEGHGGAKR